MINDAQVFLSGYVARDPRFRITASGISNVSLRVAYTPRRVDKETGEWTDGTTSFVSVVCWRTLADNVARCLHKGEPVLVKGRRSALLDKADLGSLVPELRCRNATTALRQR